MIYLFEKISRFVLAASLSLLHLSLKASSHRAPPTYNMFSFNSHPTLSIFILYSITFFFFGFSRGSFYTILLSDACASLQIYVFSWRMAVQFSAWIAELVALCVFKALVRCASRTYGPHSEVILPHTGHFCHILPLACVSLWFVTRILLVFQCLYIRGCASECTRLYLNL